MTYTEIISFLSTHKFIDENKNGFLFGKFFVEFLMKLDLENILQNSLAHKNFR